MRHGLLAACCLLALAACASSLSAVPTTTPLGERTPDEAVVAAALSYAFVLPGSLGDLRQRPRSRRIVLSSEMMRTDGGPSDTLTAHALPRAAGVSFVLLPPDRIRALARDLGEIEFAQVSRPVVRGDTAEVSVGVRRMERLDPDVRSRDGFVYSGSGVRLPVVRRGSRWVALPPTVYVMS